MSKKILKSNGAFVLIGDSPSWKTTTENGKLFSLVQDVSFGVTNERQKLKQVGYEGYAINHINRAPNVNLTIDYYLSPYLNNELLLGFAGSLSGDDAFLNRGFQNYNNNFYIVVNNNDGNDSINSLRDNDQINNISDVIDGLNNIYTIDYDGFPLGLYNGKRIYSRNGNTEFVAWDIGAAFLASGNTGWVVANNSGGVSYVLNEDTQYPWQVTGQWSGTNDSFGNKISRYANFSGFSTISFGNCYLNNYSLSFGLGSIPTVSTTYSCSNMKIDYLTGSRLTIPAINHQSGNASGAGVLDFGNVEAILSDYYIPNTTGLNTTKLPVASHQNSTFSLQNLQVGGVLLDSAVNPILQNLNINLDFKRNDLYGLGSNYVYDRKLDLPINATVDIQALVSGVSSGFISGLINNETGYNFDISFSNPTNIKATGFYKFKNAKLENLNYSMQVNEIMNFSASFSVDITSTDGFFISRAVSRVEVWSSIDDLWSTTNIIWQ